MKSYKSVKAKTIVNDLETCRYRISKDEATSLLEVANAVKMNGLESKGTLYDSAEKISSLTKKLYDKIEKYKAIAQNIEKHQELEKEYKSLKSAIEEKKRQKNYIISSNDSWQEDSRIPLLEGQISRKKSELETIKEKMEKIESALTAAGFPPTD